MGILRTKNSCFAHHLPLKTIAKEIYKSLDSFISENEIDWSKCEGLTTDWARAMSGI